MLERWCHRDGHKTLDFFLFFPFPCPVFSLPVPPYFFFLLPSKGTRYFDILALAQQSSWEGGGDAGVLRLLGIFRLPRRERCVLVTRVEIGSIAAPNSYHESLYLLLSREGCVCYVLEISSNTTCEVAGEPEKVEKARQRDYLVSSHSRAWHDSRRQTKGEFFRNLTSRAHLPNLAATRKATPIRDRSPVSGYRWDRYHVPWEEQDARSLLIFRPLRSDQTAKLSGSLWIHG